MWMRLCELRQKEVINIRDCQRIGVVVDVEFDTVTGKISHLIIPGQGKWCGFLGRDTEYIVGWQYVRQIGTDLILVDVCMDEIIKTCN